MSLETSQNHSKLKIMAIGGGSPSGSSAPAIREALSMSDKDIPSVLIIPTAKRSQEAYDSTIPPMEEFLRKIGLKVTTLHEFDQDISRKEAAEKLDNADVIYTAGGDTLHMMGVLKDLNLDRQLARRALQGDLVLSGISAGAILPMKWGHSDSMSYRPDTADNWEYVSVDGLHLIPTAITPHYDTSNERLGNRSAQFESMLSAKKEKLGFGIDNFAAMRIVDGEISQFQSEDKSHVHIVNTSDSGKVTSEPMTSQDKIALKDL